MGLTIGKTVLIVGDLESDLVTKHFAKKEIEIKNLGYTPINVVEDYRRLNSLRKQKGLLPDTEANKFYIERALRATHYVVLPGKKVNTLLLFLTDILNLKCLS